VQTNLSQSFSQRSSAEVVEAILRKCVHCGFCNATCPTYEISGDELDGPRGRIYQMKQFFEGSPANTEMLKHLDRCLGCRSCETTCPSGVKFSQLLEIGREAIEAELPRPAIDRIKRWLLTRFLNSGWLFGLTLRCGRLVSALLPASLSDAIPARQTPVARPASQHQRRLLMLSGCVQPALSPATNAAAVRILDRFGITAIEIEPRHCCGAVGLHTSQAKQGRQQAQNLIDLWWPHIESGIEAIVVTATGCGLTVSEYQALFIDDPEYGPKAKTVSQLTLDFSQLVLLLTSVGYHLCQVADSHLCCGSAGTYSLLQPEISSKLRHNKQKALTTDSPEVIATANIGCQMHIANGISVPVVHWIELLNEAID
jgi:glycolate oxidase iron-sulfur subunit